MNINSIFQCTQNEFNNLKSRDKINLLCLHCNNIYTRSKKDILDTFRRHGVYPTGCSHYCISELKKIKVICKNCSTNFNKVKSNIVELRNNFCNKSCAATYNNRHKKYGIRRSKLELYLEEQLSEIYPNLNILYSDKNTIGSELDIYIPELKLAFEIQRNFSLQTNFWSGNIR